MLCGCGRTVFAAFAGLLASLAWGSRAAAAALPPIDAQTSLLVVAPHPDDETLCCAGVIRRVIEAGGRVGIVWITSGDASELDLLLIERSLLMRPARARDLALRRMAEARAAAASLGVPAAQQLFLGYPDRGVRALLGEHYHAAYTSRFTDADAVPYRAALFPGHAYTGASLERDFAQVLEREHPTLVLAPSPLDEHPDHSATGLLTQRVIARSVVTPALRYWIVHGGEGWPSPRGLYPGLPLSPAPRAVHAAWSAFPLTPAEEDSKLAALRCYGTQMQVLAPFLLAFVRSNELFAPAH